jgi:hypothetical protein
MIHGPVPTDAILRSRLALTARHISDHAHTLPLDLTDDERVLLSHELNTAGIFIRAIDRIFSGRNAGDVPSVEWGDPPSTP